VLFLRPGVLLLSSLVGLILFDRVAGLRGYWPVALLPAVLGLVLGVHPLLIYLTSEYAVTDRRVLIKVGLVQRRSMETLLSKIEAIEVDQTLAGRLIDFGTIIVTGTGGTREAFEYVADPLEFRRQVQSQIVAREDAYRPQLIDPNVVALAPGAPSREERECPFCAERILVKARICRFCGRDVSG
jgi:uncharacterized membrane protein YdbT with pleckstrin-like domain